MTVSQSKSLDSYPWFWIGLAVAASYVASCGFLGYLLYDSHQDGLVPIPKFHLTYTTQDSIQVCDFRGNRDDFEPDGSDIKIGDRLVEDCKVIPR